MSEFDSHFPKSVNKRFEKFVNNECLRHSRYLFVRRVKNSVANVQYGFCTNCKEEHLVQSASTVKHNEDWKCEKCKSLVIVKSIGLGRGKMIDSRYAIWYEKSTVDPNAIIATGYKVTRDYRKKIDVETEFLPVMRCVFKIGSAVMAIRKHYTARCYGNFVTHYYDGWEYEPNIHSLVGKHFYTYECSQSIRSIATAVKGTPFQYSDWSGFSKEDSDMVLFFAAFSHYPFMEYLSKMGMDSLCNAIIYKEKLVGVLNLRGNTMEEILGLRKIELRDWKRSGVEMTTSVIQNYKFFRDKHFRITWETASRIGYLMSDHNKSAIKSICKYIPFERMFKYLESQWNKRRRDYQDLSNTLHTWKDYLKFCVELGMDLAEERFLMPNNLYEAHQKALVKVRCKYDPDIAEAILKSQKQLNKFSFTSSGLLIRPVKTLEELFKESEELIHCVGSYAESYAKGECIILCIRRVEEPETPFFTLEVKIPSRTLGHCNGYDNCNATDEIKQFVNKFVAAKLLTSKHKRVDTTAMAAV